MQHVPVTVSPVAVQPATTPPGGSYTTANGGTEYFLSALDFNGTLDNRIAVWALTNSSSLAKKNPTVSLSSAVIDAQVYGQPPDAQQKPGATPLGDSVNGKLEFLAGNDDRMNQVVWATYAAPSGHWSTHQRRSVSTSSTIDTVRAESMPQAIRSCSTRARAASRQSVTAPLWA